MIPEVSAEELLSRLEGDAPPQVLDIRAAERATLGHIEAAAYCNVPGSRLGRLSGADEIGLTRSRPVAVVCDRGISSRQVTAWLRQQGFDACSVRGGMLAWMLATARREVGAVSSLDRLVQFDRVGKGALGYLAFRNGEAMAVDPGRDLAPWLDELDRSGARLVAVVDTHCHADYLSGGPGLAHETGAPYRLHPADAVDPYEGRPARIAFDPLRDGDEIRVGDRAFRVEHVPGHTEGSVALRLGDELALAGDFLFVESVGRPDLADRTEDWTGLLWQSLERARREWPSSLRVFPAHYSSEAERESERAGDRVVEARFGELGRRNPPFAIASGDEFRAWIAARAGDYPDAYRWIKRANLGLARVDADLADELEAGKNQCALAS